MNQKTTITIESTVYVPVEKAWKLWIEANHIVKWNKASPDWHTPRAENDVCVGGKFLWRMESKDGSAGFDFTGTYTAVKEYKLIEYDMDKASGETAARHVKVTFEQAPDGVKITEIFDPENENSMEMQRTGWQAILDNFKEYAESVKN